MKTAEWIRYSGEWADDAPLFALTTDDGEVLWETNSPPTKRGNRELALEWGVRILETIADGDEWTQRPFTVQP